MEDILDQDEAETKKMSKNLRVFFFSRVFLQSRDWMAVASIAHPS